MRVLVIGAGIGGLSAAIALRRAGFDVLVCERAPSLDEVGAGLVLAANAMRALDRIEVGDAVRARGARGASLVVRTLRGQELMHVDLAKPELETYGVHRAELQLSLRNALDCELRLGAALVDFENDDRGVTARLEDGSEERADLLVGADGIRSLVRGRVLADGPPRYAGYAGWRAVVAPEPGLVGPGTFSESWGTGLRFGIVDIGGGRVYWFVSESARERSWERSGVKDEFLRRLQGWHEPVEALVRATDEGAIAGTGIYHRTPARRWGRGRVTLLGDAAHPMTPDVGQGAGQALEDAVVLARSLEGAIDLEAALRAYERRRLARTSAVVRSARQFGRLAQASNPVTVRLRDLTMRLTPAVVQRAQQRRLLDHELP
jgi:2-polyprenyl-6-methoxyphenol hydroxylase-like FAD-dependent oxidoreductase